jgi:PAS domain S-box-containing protein/diguanylate cyclase (GGDEF)-like protein
MDNIGKDLLRKVLALAPEGIAVCDVKSGDNVVVFVNAAFERMTGYGADELVGRNLRFLQAQDRDQEARRRLRESLARGEPCRALLRNTRKDGTPLWNEMQLLPVRDAAGTLTHWVGFHRDAGERSRTPDRPLEGLPTWMREDRLSGLASRAWFEELMLREWVTARREARRVSLLLYEIDGLQGYSETFGKSAGDACIRQVARVIASSYRRGVDLSAHWAHGCLAVLLGHGDERSVSDYAAVVAQRVADLRIHNPRAASNRFVTVTVGIAGCSPANCAHDVRVVVQGSEEALLAAKREGNGKVHVLDVTERAAEAAQGVGAETTAMTPKAG